MYLDVNIFRHIRFVLICFFNFAGWSDKDSRNITKTDIQLLVPHSANDHGSTVLTVLHILICMGTAW